MNEGKKTLLSSGRFYSKVSLYFLLGTLSHGFQTWVLRVPNRPRWAGPEGGGLDQGFCREELGLQAVLPSRSNCQSASCVALSKSLTFPGPQFSQTCHR